MCFHNTFQGNSPFIGQFVLIGMNVTCPLIRGVGNRGAWGAEAPPKNFKEFFKKKI